MGFLSIALRSPLGEAGSGSSSLMRVWLRAAVMDRGNFPRKSAAILAVVRDIHYVLLAEIFHGVWRRSDAVRKGVREAEKPQRKGIYFNVWQNCVSYPMGPARSWEVASIGKQGSLQRAC